MLQPGGGVKGPTLGIEELRAAAEQGDAVAQNDLATRYFLGEGVPQDHGVALEWFSKAAEQGNAGGQYALGLIYYDGEGVPQDYSEAARWYRKAAEQGDADAQSNLGFMYYKGEGVPQDYGEAAKWLSKAAEQGLPRAQVKLSLMYWTGTGVSQDPLMAHKWISLADSSMTFTGDRANLIAKMRDALANELTPDQIAEAQRLAREWKPKTWEELKALGVEAHFKKGVEALKAKD